MSGDLSITTVSALARVALPARNTAEVLSAPTLARRNVTAAAVIGVADSKVTLDPGTGRVVREFFDSAGTLTNSAPSRQQLQAYRLAVLTAENARTAAFAHNDQT